MEQQTMCRHHLLAAFCVLAALFSHAASGPVGPRRQTAESTYIIDTLVVVDDKMYSWFEQWMMLSLNVPKVDTEAKIKEYVSLNFHQVNAAYASINELPYTIRFQLVNTTINQNVLGKAAKGNNSLEPVAALTAFRDWLKQTPLGKYDNAVLLTKYILNSLAPGAETKGHAYVRNLCSGDGYNSAVVKEDMGFQSWQYLAHELGHILGSDHDGEQAGKNCSGADNYIMTAAGGVKITSENLVNPWRFSSCSAASFDAHINSVTSRPSASNCLSSTLTPMPEFTATANVVPGQLYPADVQCQMLNGPRSRICLGGGFGNLDEICTSMLCLGRSEVPTAEITHCTKHFAAEGTTCGNKKWCRLGKCVEAAEAPSIPKECPNGDGVLPLDGKYCPDYIKSLPFACYRQDIREKYCCSSCLASRRASEACPYGDKGFGCSKQYCGFTTTSGKPYDQECCGTCAKNTTTTAAAITTTTTTKSACVDVSRIDGVSCSTRVAMKGYNECYNTTVAARCCLTCSQKVTDIPGCKYGDYYQGNYCDMTPDNKHVCSGNKRDCCASCRALNRATSRGWSGVLLPVVLLYGFINIINTVQS